MRFIDNRSHSLQQFCAQVRQLLHKLPPESAFLLIHPFFFWGGGGGGVQAVNEVYGCDMQLKMTGSNKPPLLPLLLGLPFVVCYANRLSSSPCFFFFFKAIEAIRKQWSRTGWFSSPSVW